MVSAFSRWRRYDETRQNLAKVNSWCWIVTLPHSCLSCSHLSGIVKFCRHNSRWYCLPMGCQRMYTRLPQKVWQCKLPSDCRCCLQLVVIVQCNDLRAATITYISSISVRFCCFWNLCRLHDVALYLYTGMKLKRLHYLLMFCACGKVRLLLEIMKLCGLETLIFLYFTTSQFT